MNSLPATDSAWLEEVRAAFAYASETLSFMEVVGVKTHADALAIQAPILCAKFRGLPDSGRRFERAKEAALSSYVANSKSHSKAFEFPEVAFAFCYVATHYGYDFISEKDCERILDYLIERAERLLAPATRRPPSDVPMAPSKADPQTEELLRLTADFCKAHLNPEYGALCAKLVHAAAQGSAARFRANSTASWAAGVVHAICTTNFAFLKSQKPHIRSPQIAEFFGVSPNTVSQKSKALRDEFGIQHWDPEYSTQDMQHRNPLRRMGLM